MQSEKQEGVFHRLPYRRRQRVGQIFPKQDEIIARERARERVLERKRNRLHVYVQPKHQPMQNGHD